jgi:hypothetical protein
MGQIAIARKTGGIGLTVMVKTAVASNLAAETGVVETSSAAGTLRVNETKKD